MARGTGTGRCQEGLGKQAGVRIAGQVAAETLLPDGVQLMPILEVALCMHPAVASCCSSAQTVSTSLWGMNSFHGERRSGPGLGASAGSRHGQLPCRRSRPASVVPAQRQPGCSAQGCLSCTTGTHSHSSVTQVADCLSVHVLQDAMPVTGSSCIEDMPHRFQCLSTWHSDQWHCTYCRVSLLRSAARWHGCSA